MGNELSAESGARGHADAASVGIMHPSDEGSFFMPENGPDTTDDSDYDNIKPMEEEELKRQLKESQEEVDIYDTGVSEQLKKLLATLHEDDLSGPKPALSARAQEFVPGKPFALPASGDRVIQEFVPGKPFVLPIPEREKSSAAYSDAGSESMSSVSRQAVGLNTEAPEFVPSWQKSSSSKPSASMQKSEEVDSGDVKVWWYRDPQMVTRGPFSTTEMKAWSEKGYFNSKLECSLNRMGPFLPLQACYADPDAYFARPMDAAEFAAKMREYVLESRLKKVTAEAAMNNFRLPSK